MKKPSMHALLVLGASKMLDMSSIDRSQVGRWNDINNTRTILNELTEPNGTHGWKRCFGIATNDTDRTDIIPRGYARRNGTTGTSRIGVRVKITRSEDTRATRALATLSLDI